MKNNLLYYNISDEVEAFSTMRGAELPYNVLQPHQTHSVNIKVIEDVATTREELQATDALITNIKDFAIGVRTADCIPILLYDPVNKVIAAIHSGWKGTVYKISSLTLEIMQKRFGTKASDILSQIGPGIGPDSFQVGKEVADKFQEAGFPMDRILIDEGEAIAKFELEIGTDITGKPSPMRGGIHLNLWEANKWILEESGIRNINVSEICTYKRNDLFYSARRETIKCPRIINSIKIL